MRRNLIQAGLLAAVLTLVTFSQAMAASNVPPGFSAANQYTETLPGPAGNESASESKHPTNPAKKLGSSNTARLEAQGTVGRETAELAATTGPSEVHHAAEPQTHPHHRKHPHPQHADQSSDAGHQGQQAVPAGSGSGGSKGGGPNAQGGGSSGVDQVVGELTGVSTSGGMGIVLPLFILMSIVAAVAFTIGRSRAPKTRE